MYFEMYLNMLKELNGITPEEFIEKNDIISLFENYEEKNVTILKGIESYILSQHNLKKNNSLKKAKDSIYLAFLNNPHKYFDSYIFDSNYTNKIFSFIEKRNIKKIMKKLEKDVKIIIKQGPKDSNERHFMMKYLKSHIDLNDELQKKYINEILDQNVSTSDPEELNFFYSYVNKWMLKESSNHEINASIFPVIFSEDEEASGLARSNIIYININKNKNINALSHLRIICHETQHTIQNKKYEQLNISNNNIENSKIGLDYLKYILFGNEYYRKNYYLTDIEIDAEKEGLNYAISFLKMLGREDLYKNIDTKTNASMAEPYKFVYTPIPCKEIIEYQKEFYEYASVSYLDDIVMANPSLVKEYPILQKFYNEQGNKITFEKMIVNDLKQDDNLQLFFNYIFDYIQKGALNSFEINNNQELIFNNINLIYQETISKIKNMFAKYNDPSKLKSLKTEKNGVAISNSEIKKIFTSELIYYFSFINKISKYFYVNIDKVDSSFKDNYIKNIEQILDKLNILLNDNYYDHIIDSELLHPYIDNNFSSLLSIYNEYRKEKNISKLNEQFQKIIPTNYWDMTINHNSKNCTLKKYVFETLPKYCSYDDINNLYIDGKIISFDSHIISIIAKNDKTIDNTEIIYSLIEELKKPYDDEKIRKHIINKFNTIIEKYKKTNLDFANLLTAVLKNAEEIYNENILNNTPISIIFSDYMENEKTDSFKRK